MKVVAESFGWPFRGAWPSTFAIGSLMVLLLPVAFIPLLGYAIAATRSAEIDAALGPPPWRMSTRLVTDGFWTAVVLLVLTAPFALAWNPLAEAIGRVSPPLGSDRALSDVYAHIAAALLLALPWGLLLLLLMPHTASRFATTGRPSDLIAFRSALRDVKRDFSTWNVVAAAMVTAWILAIACIGFVCLGLLPGVFYAILVSAHASASLRIPARTTSANPSPG